MIEIEKGVPVAPKAGGASPPKYPWKKMAVGDSFFVPKVKPSSLSRQAHLAAQAIGNGTRFITRTVEGGVRVWRVS